MVRAMNNAEKQNAAILKKRGFNIITTETKYKLTFWAIHWKLICQYEILTSADQAIKDLDLHEATTLKHYPQQKLF